MKNPSYQRFRTYVVYNGERLPVSIACQLKGITMAAVTYHKREKGVDTQTAFDMVVPLKDRPCNKRRA